MPDEPKPIPGAEVGQELPVERFGFRIRPTGKAEIVKAARSCAMRVNRDEFEGHPPETVTLVGYRSSWTDPVVAPDFKARAVSWNEAYNEARGAWDTIDHTATGLSTYEAADFGVLAAMNPERSSATKTDHDLAEAILGGLLDPGTATGKADIWAIATRDGFTDGAQINRVLDLLEAKRLIGSAFRTHEEAAGEITSKAKMYHEEHGTFQGIIG